MKKFLLSFIIILCLMLTLSACGDDENNNMHGESKPPCTHDFVVITPPNSEIGGHIECSKCHYSDGFPALTDSRVSVESSNDNETVYKFTTDSGYTVTYARPHFEFAPVDGGYCLIKYYGSATNVVIPSTYNGMPVVKVGRDDNFNVFNSADIVSVTFPNSVTEFKSLIFGTDCTAIRELTLPSVPDSIQISSFIGGSVNNFTKITITSGTSIGNSFFRDCTNLKDIYLPSTIKSLGWGVFTNCESLENVYFDCTLAEYCGITYDSGWERCHPLDYADNLYIKNENNEYYNCAKAETLVIPEGVTAINPLSFSFFKMQTLILPDSVTSIGLEGFKHCYNLSVAIFGSGLTSIGKDGFYQCTSLETVYYKGSNTEWNRISIDNSDSPSNYYVFESDKYYYSEEGDLFAFAKGKEYWHFDENGMPVFWTFNITDTVDGKTFNHTNTEVIISDAYWSMLEEAEAQGMLEIVLDPETLFFYQNSADKDEFQQKITDNFNSAYSSLSISFTNGTIVGIDPYPASYIEVDGNTIYKTQTEEIIFTIDADGKLIWDNSNEYITVIHTFAVSD